MTAAMTNWERHEASGEMSFHERRAADRKDFAACKAAATVSLAADRVQRFELEVARVEQLLVPTQFKSRDALQFYIGCVRKSATGGRALYTKDLDEVYALAVAIWPKYAAARGIDPAVIESPTSPLNLLKAGLVKRAGAK